MFSALTRLRWPLLVLALLLAPTLVWPELFEQLGSALDSTARMARNGLTAAIWLAGAWLLIRLVDVGFWDAIVAPRLGGKVPGLLKDVVAVAIFSLAVTGVMALVFDLDVTGFWATSGVVGLVLGFALQSMIADVFSGIALNVDRPSLLTGEPRSATVRAATEIVAFEIRKADLEPLFAARRELATAITEKVAERRLRSKARLEAANAAPPSEEETRSLADQIFGKMRGLFGI